MRYGAVNDWVVLHDGQGYLVAPNHIWLDKCTVWVHPLGQDESSKALDLFPEKDKRIHKNTKNVYTFLTYFWQVSRANRIISIVVFKATLWIFFFFKHTVMFVVMFSRPISNMINAFSSSMNIWKAFWKWYSLHPCLLADSYFSWSIDTAISSQQHKTTGRNR